MPTLNRGGKEPPKIWSWLAHHPWVPLAMLIVGDTARIFATHPGDWLAVFFTMLGTSGILIYVVANSRHRIGVVCEHCMAENPLDGDAEAEKHRWQLKTVHSLRSKRWFMLGIVVFSIGIYYLIFAIDKGSKLTIIPFMVVWVVFGLDWICMRQHQRLYPWCPFCDHGKGRGPREVVPTPTPVRTDEKVLS